jgi:hypothetical protein
MARFSLLTGVRLKSTLPVSTAKPRNAARMSTPEVAVKMRNFVAA